LAQRYPALTHMTAEHLGAKFMGRWQSGTPVMTAPNADRPAIGRDPYANNDFKFLAQKRRASPDGSGAADPLGVRCPRAAHIRRAYPRDGATSGLTEANIETHRLLRRSIPFVDGTPPAQEHGLLFLAYQTSIERQFEFITRAWLNNPHLHDTDDGHDPIAGQSFGARGDRGRIFSMAIRSRTGNIERVSLELPGDWVVPTGGEYFFVPPLSALARLRV
jgi:Dyp-type peroxidase family